MDPFTSATELAELIRGRHLSPVEVVQCYLDRIDAFDHEVNAFVWRNDDEVMHAARCMERAIARGEDVGPFAGVPMPVKDTISVAGQPNSRGSLGFSDVPQTTNDLIVDRILAGGFLLMGRTNTPEMGMTQVTENQRYGITRNPWNLGRTPGGSSGGASAAVAAGMAPVASGGDGGGSIRMPASCTGLVGLKPSRARVPSAVPVWEHGTTGGVLTRTVEDTARILDLLSVPDLLGWYRAPRPPRPFAEELRAPVERLRIGLLLDAPNGLFVDPDCVRAATDTAQLLEGDGHEIVPVDPDIISTLALDIYLFTVVAAALHTVPWEDPAVAEPFVAARMKMGERQRSSEYAKSVAHMHLESRKMISHWVEDFDVLLSPTLATRVPEVGVVLADANRVLDGSSELEARMLAFCAFVNITGLPAISCPVGSDRDGLPVGVQLVGGPFQEATLIRLASRLERDHRWFEWRPPRYAGAPVAAEGVERRP